MLQFHDLSHLHELPKSQNTKQRYSISTLKAARRTKIIALHKRNRTTPSLTATSIGTQNELPLFRYSRTASSIRNLNVQRRRKTRSNADNREGTDQREGERFVNLLTQERRATSRGERFSRMEQMTSSGRTQRSPRAPGLRSPNPKGGA